MRQKPAVPLGSQYKFFAARCDLTAANYDAQLCVCQNSSAASPVCVFRNETTVMGLMAEGYAHGYHSIPLLRKHEHFVRSYVASAPVPREPATASADPSPSGDESLYWYAFNRGKAAGRRDAERGGAPA